MRKQRIFLTTMTKSAKSPHFCGCGAIRNILYSRCKYITSWTSVGIANPHLQLVICHFVSWSNVKQLDFWNNLEGY